MIKRKEEIVGEGLSREDLEALAVDVVCTCLYYDLVDTLEETPDAELLMIIEMGHCVICNK
jgi:hypothetical protein